MADERISFGLFSSSSILFLCCIISSTFAAWPLPYRRYDHRPISSPFCQAGVIPFCPSGEPDNSMPLFNPTDPVEIYALKKPVWQFKFGDLLGKFHIIHDALGIKNVKTGHNYTMEWYELFQLFNCTFPHLLKNDTLQWCNQGATCIYDGIEDKLWHQNGTLAKVATMTGDQFNTFADWVLKDNRTGLFYETWTVESEPGGQMWFDAFDCASWVLRAFDQLGVIGAKFDHSVSLNYTRIHLYSSQPIYLGNETEIFGNKSNAALAKDMINFYKDFQSHVSDEKLVLNLLDALLYIMNRDKFYLYYNSAYWLLPMKKPFASLSYDQVPLPGGGGGEVYHKPHSVWQQEDEYWKAKFGKL
ncbi:Ceroid-lipofuscinosis neuronal protein 5-like [Mizuhopecten yessoensis]|uniref:Bis(monoacylglycero)phosphate synthase CLN5 n=2 Tax=Mizuhopecten yessoensis TaxID=6573 RepID=A0A210PLA1_MIZYE|nr:Ceroid-lipofuscinosis neuronal protein 5-like [Mizuhopecten yessoensis]